MVSFGLLALLGGGCWALTPGTFTNPLGIEDLKTGHSLLGAKMWSVVRDHRNQLCMHVRGMGA